MKPDTELPTSWIVNKRRRYSKEFKHQVVKAALAPGVSVASIALEHRLNANVLFKWRRKFLRDLAARKGRAATMLPVMIEGGSDGGLPACTIRKSSGSERARGAVLFECIEIELPDARVLLKGAVDAQALRSVLEMLAKR